MRFRPAAGERIPGMGRFVQQKSVITAALNGFIDLKGYLAR